MSSLTVLKTMGDGVVLSYERTFSRLVLLTRLWDEGAATLIADGVQLLEDSGTSDCEGIVRLESLDSKDVLGYAIADTDSTPTRRFTAAKVLVLDGEGNAENSRRRPQERHLVSLRTVLIVWSVQIGRKSIQPSSRAPP